MSGVTSKDTQMKCSICIKAVSLDGLERKLKGGKVIPGYITCVCPPGSHPPWDVEYLHLSLSLKSNSQRL